ncbi:MAG TPA: periplasmic heavy metal sensor [Thermoanaerobaculia bacterium]
MIKRFILCVALALTLATSVSAAPLPPGKWWRRPEFITSLALTNDQQTRLDLIFRMAANELIDLRAEAEKTSIAIRSELDQPQINRDQLRKLAARLSETQGKLFDHELMMLVDMRSVLSDDQWSRLRSELDRPRQGERPQRH